MMATARTQPPLVIWFAAIILGCIYFLGALGRSGVAFETFAYWPKALVIALKGAATGLLVVVAWLSATSRPQSLLAVSLSIIWLADITLALGAVHLSGTIFVVAHLVAIAAYWQLRSPEKAMPLFRAFAFAIVLFGMASITIPAQFFPLSMLLVLFPFFSLLSAAAALLSRFHFLDLGSRDDRFFHV